MTNEEFIESIRLEGEEWKDVVGYEGYYMVSNLGRIMRKHVSYPRIDKHNTVVTNPKILKPTKLHHKKQCYCYVTLCSKNVRRKMLVHRIVGLAFVPNPKNRSEIDHIDGNGLNNLATNLRWCNRSENNMNPIARKRQSKSHVGKQMSTLWKPVVCISKDGVVKHYKSMSHASEDGYSRSSIIDSIRHPNRPVRKRQWMYLSDYEKYLVNQ